jgi:hypothetical protein
MRKRLLAFSSPGLMLCAMVPLRRIVLFQVPSETAIGQAVRVILLVPVVILTIGGMITPIVWPFVISIALYRSVRRDARGKERLLAVACVVGSTLGTYIWLVMVGEALHGHSLPMFPWDPPGLSTR